MCENHRFYMNYEKLADLFLERMATPLVYSVWKMIFCVNVYLYKLLVNDWFIIENSANGFLYPAAFIITLDRGIRFRANLIHRSVSIKFQSNSERGKIGPLLVGPHEPKLKVSKESGKPDKKQRGYSISFQHCLVKY